MRLAMDGILQQLLRIKRKRAEELSETHKRPKGVQLVEGGNAGPEGMRESSLFGDFERPRADNQEVLSDWEVRTVLALCEERNVRHMLIIALCIWISIKHRYMEEGQVVDGRQRTKWLVVVVSLTIKWVGLPAYKDVTNVSFIASSRLHYWDDVTARELRAAELEMVGRMNWRFPHLQTYVGLEQLGEGAFSLRYLLQWMHEIGNISVETAYRNIFCRVAYIPRTCPTLDFDLR